MRVASSTSPLNFFLNCKKWKSAISTALLSDSVPQLVKQISVGELRALIRYPRFILAFCKADRHGALKTCEEDGFPKQFVMKGIMALVTSGKIGVVAL